MSLGIDGEYMRKYGEYMNEHGEYMRIQYICLCILNRLYAQIIYSVN